MVLSRMGFGADHQGQCDGAGNGGQEGEDLEIQHCSSDARSKPADTIRHFRLPIERDDHRPLARSVIHRCSAELRSFLDHSSIAPRPPGVIIDERSSCSLSRRPGFAQGAHS